MILLVSQNRQSEKDRIRADLDYQVNVKAHLEVMALHQKVDRLSAMVGERRDFEDGEDVPAAVADGAGE